MDESNFVTTKLKLKELIVNDLDVNVNLEDIKDEVSLYDGGLGLDSIAIINFLVLIEKKFEISFDENEISAKVFSTINNLAELVSLKLMAKNEILGKAL